MADFFDSSAFLAAVSEDDPEHGDAARAWRSSTNVVMYAHGLLECFSVLTGGRHPAALAPSDACLLISRNIQAKNSAVIQFAPSEMLALLSDAGRHSARGGAVYDYMHICAARKALATRIVTLNIRHFKALAPDLAPIIRHPSEM